MFDLLESFTLICGGEVKTQPEAEGFPDAPSAEEDLLADWTLFSSFVDNPSVDPMDDNNYLTAHLTRPMGILFEENYDVQHGGAFVAEINEGCSAAADGSICRGDQLIAIGEKRVIGMDFDDIMQVIEESDTNIKLTVFRGPAESLYGPSWLGEEYVPERGEEAALVEEEDSESEVVGDVKADLFGAVTTAMLDAVGETDKADETLVGEEFHVVKETTAEVVEELVVLENEDEADEMNEVYVDVEKEAVCEDGLEKVADAAEEVLIIEEEVDSEEDVGHEGSVEKKADASDEAEDVLNENEVDAGEAVLVMDEVEKEEEVACDADVESVPSMLNEAANDSNLDWLDSHYENTASQTISTALAAVVRKEISNDGKSNLEENSLPLRELPLKKLEAGSTLIDITKSFDEKKEVVGTDGAAAVVAEDDVNVDEDIAGEAEPETAASMLNGPVTNASMTKDLLDNDASLISDDELDDVKLKASVENYFLQLDGLTNH